MESWLRRRLDSLSETMRSHHEDELGDSGGDDLGIGAAVEAQDRRRFIMKSASRLFAERIGKLCATDPATGEESQELTAQYRHDPAAIFEAIRASRRRGGLPTKRQIIDYYFLTFGGGHTDEQIRNTEAEWDRLMGDINVAAT